MAQANQRLFLVEKLILQAYPAIFFSEKTIPLFTDLPVYEK